VYKGELGEAEALLTENLALRRRLYGASHPTIGMSLMSLGLLRQRQGRRGDARELFAQALAMEQELFGAEYPLAREARGYLTVLDRRPSPP
jgi:tetratricopeptide (TPR) repeat protein